MTVFVMTDVVGSTKLWEAHPKAMGDALALHDRVVHGVMTERRGTVFKHTGDGMIAAFADSDGDAAADAAVAAVDQLGRATWGDTGALSIRVSVHAGTAVERDGDYFGTPVNRVARINGVGHGGQVLSSNDARVLMSRSQVSDLGRHQLRDLSEPIHLWQLNDGRYPRLRSLVQARHNLPRQSTEIVGREREVDELVDLLDQHRLVTIAGVGGGGKTRLAIEVGATMSTDYPGGVWFVDLTPLRSGNQIGPAIMAAMGLDDQGTTPVDTVGAIAEAIEGDPSLILLDNCEHLVDAAADFAEDLLGGLEEVSILATSCEALALPEERTWRIPGLEDASVELFLQRAAAAGVVGLESALDTVSDVCSSLDHIPLAIELAAAQTAFMPVTELAGQLDNRFVLLDSRRSRRRRQQTLQTMMEWSFDLLDDAERRVLCDLAVFTGSFSLAGAAAVAGYDDASSVLPVVRSLAEQSLIAPLEGGRYRLLETVRLFGLEHLAADDRVEEVKRRHASWVRSFCGLAAIETGDWTSFVQLNDRQLDERVSYFEVLDWAALDGDDETLADLLLGGWAVFLVERPQRAVDLIATLPRPSDHDGDRLLHHVCCEAYAAFGVGDYERSIGPARECFHIARQRLAAGRPSLPALTSTTLDVYGYLLTTQGDIDGAREVLRLLTDLADAEGQVGGASFARDTLSVDLHFNLGDLDGAGAAVDRLLANVDLAPPHLVGLIWFFSARLELARHRYPEALEAAQRAATQQNIAEVRTQIPELTGLAQIGAGRWHDAVVTLRADQGPQFELYRLYQLEGKMAGLLALFHALGVDDEAQRWLRALRDTTHPVSAPYRRSWLEEVAGGADDLAALPPSELVDMDAEAVERCVEAAFGRLEQLLSDLATARTA